MAAVIRYEFKCDECRAKLFAKPEIVGTKKKCPKCGTLIKVPHLEATHPATPRQKEFARKLGIDFASDVDVSRLSELIDDKFLCQSQERWKDLGDLEIAESYARRKYRAELLAECDPDDVRLSFATAEQMIDELARRRKAAILISIDRKRLRDLNVSSNFQLELSSTEDLTPKQQKSVFAWLARLQLRDDER